MRRQFSFCASLGAAVVLFAGAASADETVLQEVVVTASFNKTLLDIAQPAAVLAGDDLTRQRAGSLGETLSRQLGVSSSYFGPTASRPVIRGLGGYRVQTLQDGLSTLDVGSLSDDHATTLDPALAEQIEVLKGPATLLYGSGAAGGLINIVTPRLSNPPPLLDGFVELRGGSANDERAGVASMSVGTGSFGLYGDFFKSRSDAIDIPGAMLSDRLTAALLAAGESAETSIGRIPNAFSDTQGGALGASIFGERSSAGANFNRFESRYGIPSEEEAFIAMEQERVDAKGEWRRDEGWFRGLLLRGAYSEYRHTEFEAPGEPGTEFTQDAYEIRASGDHSHSDRWRGTFGVQVAHLDFGARGDEAFVPPSLTESIGIFALEEFDANAWTLSLGARYERQRIDVSDAGLQNFDDGALSFAGGAVYAFSSQDSLAINLTHSARHPQPTELYADGPHVAAQRFEIGVASLDTELANTIDVTLRRSSDALSWSLGAFYNDYRNFVFAAPTGNSQDDLPEVEYRQAAANLWGFEAEVWMPLYRGTSTMRARLMTDFVRGELKSGEPLPQIPPLRVGAALHFDRGAWHAELEGIHHARQDRVAPNELVTDRYFMLNADLSVTVKGSGDWLIFVRGTNLLDEEARQHTSSLKDVVPLPGRSLHAGARITF